MYRLLGMGVVLELNFQRGAATDAFLYRWITNSTTQSYSGEQEKDMRSGTNFSFSPIEALSIRSCFKRTERHGYSFIQDLRL